MELAASITNNIASTSAPQSSPSRKRPRESNITPMSSPVVPRKSTNLDLISIIPINGAHHPTSYVTNGLPQRDTPSPSSVSQTADEPHHETNNGFSEILLNDHNSGWNTVIGSSASSCSSSSTQVEFMVSNLLLIFIIVGKSILYT